MTASMGINTNLTASLAATFLKTDNLNSLRLWPLNLRRCRQASTDSSDLTISTVDQAYWDRNFASLLVKVIGFASEVFGFNR